MVSGPLAVTPGQILHVTVGGKASYWTPSPYGGGGAAASHYATTETGGARYAGAGGGASDVRLGGAELGDRAVIAGGGGGAGAGFDFDSNRAGGQGGGGAGIAAPGAPGGGGGTAMGGGTAGHSEGGPADGIDGSLGTGGDGGVDGTASGAGGGGGGGLHGGGGGAGSYSDYYEGGGGGGGSSLVPLGWTAMQGSGTPSAYGADGSATISYSSSTPTPTGLATAPAGPSPENDVVITGAAPAGATVDLYAGGDCFGTPVATGSAAELADPGISVHVADDTTTVFTAKAAVSGVPSSCSSTTTYVEDSTAPTAPGPLAFSAASPSSANTTRVTGSAPAGSALIRLYTTPDCSGDALATLTPAQLAGPGATLTVPDDSTTTVRGTASDAAGNVSPCSTDGATYVEDSTAPAAPARLAFTPGGPSSASRARLTGTAEPGGRVQLFTGTGCGGTALATVSAQELAAVGVAIALTRDATNLVSARVTDAAGNVSPCSEPAAFVHDDIAPTADILAITPPSGSNDATPRVTGEAGADAVLVRVHLTSNCFETPAASGTPAAFAGAGIPVALPADTVSTIRVSAVDAAGNESGCSEPFEHLRDASGPRVTLTTPTDGSSTTDATPLIAGAGGTAERDRATVTVELYAGGGTNGTPVVTLRAARDAVSGAYASRPAAALEPGLYTARARQRDDAGNEGSSATSTFTVRAPAPMATPTRPSAPATASVLPLPAPGAPVGAPTTRSSFWLSAIRVSARGAHVVRVSVPGPGKIEILETSRRSSVVRSAPRAAKAAAGLQPGPDAFVLARRRTVVEQQGNLELALPSPAGAQRTLREQRGTRARQRVNLYATYTPPAGRPRLLKVRFALPSPAAPPRWRVVSPTSVARGA